MFTIASIGYMRPKLADGAWKSPFDVLSTHGQGFIEGNAWNYSLYVPQDIPAMIINDGREKRFAKHLDSLFTMHLADENFKETEDITRDGIIGYYVHGNEPGHHIPYLYNWAGQPWKTQNPGTKYYADNVCRPLRMASAEMTIAGKCRPGIFSAPWAFTRFARDQLNMPSAARW